jgi:cholesterol transport system auxiliary component
MTERTLQRRLLLMLPLVAGACSVLPSRPYQERRQWPLTAETPTTPFAVRPTRAVLLVRDTVAGPGLERRGLQRLRPDGSLAVDYWNEWAVPPADGAGAALRADITEAGLFRAVLAPGSRAQPDLVLESELDALLGADGQGRAVLSFVLLKAGQPVLQSRETGTAPWADDSSDALAKALRLALGQAVRRVTERLVGFV